MAASTTLGKCNSSDARRFSHFDGRVVSAIRKLEDIPLKRSAARQASSLLAWDMLCGLVADVAKSNDATCLKDEDGRPWAEIAAYRHGASISHSRGWVVVAVAVDPGLLIGIDLEYRDEGRSIPEMAEQLGLPRTTSVSDFYDAWCRYEAIFKATGESDPVVQLDLSPVVLPVPADFASSLVMVDAREKSHPDSINR